MRGFLLVHGGGVGAGVVLVERHFPVLSGPAVTVVLVLVLVLTAPDHGGGGPHRWNSASRSDYSFWLHHSFQMIMLKTQFIFMPSCIRSRAGALEILCGSRRVDADSTVVAAPGTRE